MELEGKSGWTTEMSRCRRCKRSYLCLRHVSDRDQVEVCMACYRELIVDVIAGHFAQGVSSHDNVPSANI